MGDFFSRERELALIFSLCEGGGGGWKYFFS